MCSVSSRQTQTRRRPPSTTRGLEQDLVTHPSTCDIAVSHGHYTWANNPDRLHSLERMQTLPGQAVWALEAQLSFGLTCRLGPSNQSTNQASIS